MKKILFVIAILFFGLSATAQAVLVTPVASNAYITKNGFDMHGRLHALPLTQ